MFYHKFYAPGEIQFFVRLSVCMRASFVCRSQNFNLAYKKTTLVARDTKLQRIDYKHEYFISNIFQVAMPKDENTVIFTVTNSFEYKRYFYCNMGTKP